MKRLVDLALSKAFVQNSISNRYNDPRIGEDCKDSE